MQSGCSAAVVVDNSAAELTPPGIATDSIIKIPVVMITQVDGDGLVAAVGAAQGLTMKIRVHHSADAHELLEVSDQFVFAMMGLIWFSRVCEDCTTGPYTYAGTARMHCARQQ